VVIIFQKRRWLGAVIAVLTVLAVISVQYRVQDYVLQHAQFESVLRNKLLFILLLRQQNLELLILFCLYVVAMISMRVSTAPAMETYAAYQPAITLR